MKYTPTPVVSGYNSETALNENFDAIKEAIDDSLDKTGGASNSMSADVDMNSQDLLNARSVYTSELVLNGEVIVATGDIAQGGINVDRYTLSAGQTVVPLVRTVYNASLYVNATSGDRGKLFSGTGFDYVIATGGNSLTLGASYPEGTLLEVVYNETAPDNTAPSWENEELVTRYTTVSQAVTASLKVGQLCLIDERDYSLWEVILTPSPFPSGSDVIISVTFPSLSLQLAEQAGTENLKGYEVYDMNNDKPYRMESEYTLEAGTIFGIAHTGQSLAEGGVGGDSVSGVTTTSYPGRTLMLSPQPVALSSNSNANVPVDLVEVTRVTIGHSLIKNLAASNENTYVFSGQAWGGMNYAALKKLGTTAVYEKVVQQVANVEDSYSGIRYLGVTCIHGEQDGLDNNASYEANLVEWQDDFETDIKAITSQTEDVPMYLCQTASGGGYGRAGGITETTFPTPLAQLEAHINNTNIVLVCSKYHFEYADHSHIKNISQRILGEYYEKAFSAGTSHEPLRPSNFSLGSSSVVVTFTGNVGSLAFDTTIVAAATNQGFSYVDDASRTITGVSLTGTNEVTVTLSGTIGANAVLGYAYHNGAGGATNQVSGLGDRGNLRDSDTAVSSYDSAALYNWCVIFREQLN